MTEEYNRVFIYPNPTRDNTVKALPEIFDHLLGSGFKIFMEDIYKGVFAKEYPVVSFLPLDEAIGQSLFILVVGGDGTILHIAPDALRLDKPIVGINLGTMGFLSELDMSNLDLIEKIPKKQYLPDSRIMIDVTVVDGDGKAVFHALGLNDAVVMKGDIAKIAKMSVSVNDSKVMSFAGDGVVVCTPTGSTAYSLSAGGPIIEPTSSCIVVTPVCPHSLGIKSFVVSSDREIKVTVPAQENTIKLSVDGFQNFDLGDGQSVVIKQAEKSLTLMRLTGIGFYQRINQKLSIERF